MSDLKIDNLITAVKFIANEIGKKSEVNELLTFDKREYQKICGVTRHNNHENCKEIILDSGMCHKCLECGAYHQPNY